jgi:pilus assembly protein Flp/PilA
MVRKFREFVTDDAATAIEYAMLVGGIALAIVAVVQGVGPKLNTTFSSVSTLLK